MNSSLKIYSIITLLSFILAGCSGDDKKVTKDEHHDEKSGAIKIKLTKAAQKDIGLRVETLQLTNAKGYLNIPAKIVTNQNSEALIGTLVEGRIKKVYVNVGDNVKQGQVLFSIESLEVGALKAGLIKAKANLDFAKSTLDREKKLFEKGFSSQQMLDQVNAEYNRALADFNAEDKKIHSVGLIDEDVFDVKGNALHSSGLLNIKSPINGTVVERNLVTGQLIESTSNGLRIMNTSTVWVDGQVYEKDIDRIVKTGKLTFVTLAYGDEEFSGNIINIGQTVDEKTRTITIRGEIPNRGGKLKPEMFGEMTIRIGEEVETLMLDAEALVKEGSEEYVFVQVNDTLFEKRIVKTGFHLDEKVEITEGLKAGEKVVTKGSFYLKSEIKKEEIEGDAH